MARSSDWGGGNVPPLVLVAENVSITTQNHAEFETLLDDAIAFDCDRYPETRLVILCAALGFTNYLIDAQIPAKGAAWVTAGIHSRWAFLLILNGSLLVVGCLMYIFSAIFVVVPLILPVAAAFEIDPLHLGAVT